MEYSHAVSQYGRWQICLGENETATQLIVTAPSGRQLFRPFFAHQPGEFTYDHHGYEKLTAVGALLWCARVTPAETGEHAWTVERDGQEIARGSFAVTPADHGGYVEVSEVDPRYFALSDGSSWCPIGPNLCSVPFFQLPRGMEHFETGGGQATLGLHEYERWFRLLSQNGGTFTRIWLSNPYLQAETETAGQTDPLIFNRLDGLIELARKYGIRLKLCFDHFRAFQSDNPTTKAWFMRRYMDPVSGREPVTMDEWMEDERWQDLWMEKVQAYLARYGGDPVVMAWELWNEMDCIEGTWEIVREWTRKMLSRIKAAAPEHLVVQSLGSFDDEKKYRVQDDLCAMEEMDFQQVHRYLDQGSSWDICHTDVPGFSVQAVQATRRPDKPILLAETGAVNDRHTGVFRYCRMDDRGIILHDTTFPAFFAGSAGTGQCWFWDSYVDIKSLWPQFKPFAELVEGIELDKEGFVLKDLSNEASLCLALEGKTCTLIWLRNRQDTWHQVLRDWQEPEALPQQTYALAGKLDWWGSSWPEDAQTAKVEAAAGELQVTGMRYGLFVRLARNGA